MNHSAPSDVPRRTDQQSGISTTHHCTALHLHNPSLHRAAPTHVTHQSERESQPDGRSASVSVPSASDPPLGRGIGGNNLRKKYGTWRFELTITERSTRSRESEGRFSSRQPTTLA